MDAYPDSESSHKTALAFAATRVDALGRLAEFLPLAADYARQRNQVDPGHPAVSRLSPAVRARLIHEDEVAHAALRLHGFAAAEKFVQEVYWRRYWKGWLANRPQVWRDFCEFGGVEDDTGPDHLRERARAVASAQSGVPIMDRFAQELIDTGYLHNHARMWFAGFWIHYEGLPWQWGADFFYRNLLDADPASNTLSWRWVAGLQTPGKVYVPSADNIRRYCSYPEAADPRLDDHLSKPNAPTSSAPPPPVATADSSTFVNEAAGLIDEKSLVWLHGEDGSFWETGEAVPLAAPAPAVAVIDEELMTRYGLSPHRRRWIKESLSDIVERWNVRFPHTARLLDCSRDGGPSDLADALLRAATEQGCRHVWAMKPEVGPLMDNMPKIQSVLAAQGIGLSLFESPQDREIRSSATRGFFPFWQIWSKRLSAVCW